MTEPIERTYRFRGGLQLEQHTERQTSEPIAVMPPPAVVIIPLQQHIGNPARAVVAAGDHVLRGQLIGEHVGPMSANVHASTSGTVRDVGRYPVASPSGLDDLCVVIDSDGEDRSVEREPRGHDYHLDDPNLLRVEVADAGVVGLGGAAFPTAIKLAAEVEQRLHTLVLNGAECEPYISCDDMLMRERADEIISGAVVMLHILQINKCIVAVESDKPVAIEALRVAIEATADDRITLRTVPAIYPEGGERQLLTMLSGKEVPHDGLPIDIGYLCHNVATAYAIGHAILHGEAVTSRIVTVCGPGIAQPRNIEARIGTSLADIVEFCGGYTDTAARLIMGGAMMGVALAGDDVPISKAFNCLLVLDDTARPNKPYLPCIRCGDCATVCPALLLPQQLFWYARSRDFERARQFNLDDCIECGCCDIVCPSEIPLTEYFRYAKSAIVHHDAARHSAARARFRFDNRNERLQDDARRREEQTQRRKEALAQEPEISAEEADEPRDMIQAAVERARAKRAERAARDDT